ncbi:DNA gyrase subunit A [Nanoarchaeota archaeon]
MDEIEPKSSEKIVSRVIEDEMQESYLGYAMSVIVGRALPDVRDGLKPVHRRILYALYDMGMLHNKPFKKSARIVGEVLGKYHPHGDTAVYDSLVRMAQSFSLRYPLVQGQGNFGSVDGDNAAAMRYTEAKLAKIAEELLEDIKKETVDFVPNFDGSLKEPAVLPAKLPNLLINGTSGIAVGMATNIPPHNIIEVIDAATALIDNPELSIPDLMNYVKGPDFPTGATILGRAGIKAAYHTGRGIVKVRAKTDIEEVKGKTRIIVTEIPYMVNKSMLIEEIANLIRSKKVQGISDLRDESDRDGMRILIELRKDANSNVVLNQLFKHTRLETSFGMNMLALVNNEPKVLNLRQILQYYIDHRKEVVTKRTQFDLKETEARLHILVGLITALNNIDLIVKGIKESKTVQDASNFLIQNYKLTEIQAKAILEMRLQKLSSLEQDKIKQENQELTKFAEELREILANESKIFGIIKKELAELKEKYGDERKTNFEDHDGDIEIEDLIEQEDVVVTMSHAGYVKRLAVDTYKAQKRGGKGIIGAETREEDFIEHLFVANTHSYILFFTNKGKVYWLKVHNIPEAGRQAKGKAIVNLLQLAQDEKINAFIPVKEFDDQHFLVLATKNGTIKKTNLSQYSRPRQGGIIGIILDGEDELIGAQLTDGNQNIMLATSNGMAIKFDEKDARPIGRTSKGVRGIALKNNDEVVSMILCEPNTTIMTITKNGFGKRTKEEDYRVIGRAGVGVINIQCSERNGEVVNVQCVNENDEIMFVSQNGIIIRIAASDISTIGRNTQGVRLMKLKPGDRVVAAAKVVSE